MQPKKASKRPAPAGVLPQRPADPNLSKPEEEQKLIAILKSEGPEFDKNVACRRLRVIATKAAVPALAALLSNENLCDAARYGLEPIPDPSVDEALRAALGRLKGRQLAGVINSIGIRRDPKAVAPLARRVGDSDAEVAAACAAALGKIGGPEAAKALTDALGKAPAAVKPAVGDACVTIADTLLAGGKNAEAAALFDQVRSAKPSKPVLTAATRGAILARGVEGTALLLEQLRGEDWDLCDLALRLVREIPGPELTRAAAAQVAKLPPDKQPLLLRALGDRRDAAALPAVLEAARGGDAKVRVAALQAAGQLGDAAAVPALFEAALASEIEVASAGQAGLAGISNTNAKANDAVAGRLADKDAKVRRVAVEAVGKRLDTAAVPQLIKTADDSDAQVRVAALNALTALALAKRGEAAARDQAKQAALALADKLAQSNPADAAEAKRKLTETPATSTPARMKSPGL